jgi:glycosyltransferase involved in cell wall biosynthesis
VTLPKVLLLVSPYGPTMRSDAFATAHALRGSYEIRAFVPREDLPAYRDLRMRVVAWNPTGFWGMLFGIRRLRELARYFKPDLVHAHGFPAASVSLGTFPDRMAARTIVSFHDPVRNRELPQKLFDKRFPVYVRRAGALTSAYPSLGRALERRFALDDGSISLLPHGVDDSQSEPLRGSLARPPGRAGPLIGWAGRLGADRAWEAAIDALVLVRKTEPAARLAIAGIGPSRQFVAAHARQRGVADAVDLRGAIAPTEFFAGLDMLVLPSTVDAQPDIMLAALCWGLPVIAGNGGAYTDALQPLSTGWLVPDDAAGLAEGVRDAWARIDTAWEGAMAQRPLALEQYGRRNVLDKTRALYEATLRAPVAR